MLTLHARSMRGYLSCIIPFGYLTTVSADMRIGQVRFRELCLESMSERRRVSAGAR